MNTPAPPSTKDAMDTEWTTEIDWTDTLPVLTVDEILSVTESNGSGNVQSVPEAASSENDRKGNGMDAIAAAHCNNVQTMGRPHNEPAAQPPMSSEGCDWLPVPDVATADLHRLLETMPQASSPPLSKEAELTVHLRLSSLVYGQHHAKQEVLKLLANSSVGGDAALAAVKRIADWATDDRRTAARPFELARWSLSACFTVLLF